LFLISNAKVRLFFQSTKYFVLKFVNGSIFFYSSIILYEQQWILFTRVLISLKLNPDNDSDHQVLIRIKKSNYLCRLFAHFTVYNLSEINLLYPPSASRACNSKCCRYKMKKTDHPKGRSIFSQQDYGKKFICF
jgi:hypothetical protein